MSKATKLRAKAKKQKDNETLNDLITKKLSAKPQKITNIEDTILSNGEKGLTITFDLFNKK